ncbi:MAG TPA: nicotinate-nucleotide--dimethylbenzimidazole phosphoribosyltransferase [Actinomycetota bacterium]|nr:nicotinate-nucleotide--dimethylbenzimidazole phosphoribosyltransferase [Actinomycetota bacterium]
MTASLDAALASIAPIDEAIGAEAAVRLDAKTKPPGSLGRLEELACRLAAIRGALPTDPLRPAIVVAAADHGVWIEGVSPYPQEVTGQMLANFAGGGAAVSILARQAGARLVVVDAGVINSPAVEGVRSAVVAGVRGTGNIAVGPAMTRDVAVGLIERGIALAHELADEGAELVAVGDMGIANTTSASALCAALLPATPASVCGPGTGLDAAGVVRKADVVAAALIANGLAGGNGRPDPVRALAGVGGLEIAFLVGVILGAASRRRPILLDGIVTGAAALVAATLAPAATGSMIAATRSPEPGHALVLERLGLEPLLDLGLRLGEGSGAALALPLVRSAVAILTEMATFEGAGVSRA